MSRRVILLAGAGESTSIVYHALVAEFHIAKVILEDPVPRREFLRRRARRYGWAKAFGQVLFVALIVPYLRFEAHARIAEIKKQHGLRDDPIDEAKIIRLPSANASECLAALRELAPDVVVVNGTRILSKQVLEAIPAPFLNIHAGMTPKYRGVHGGYWALANSDREHCGVTVHRVESGIDTGKIVAQARIEPTAADNFVSYPFLQLATALPLLVSGIKAPAAGPALAGIHPSHLWSHPTVFEYLTCRLRSLVR